MFVLAAFSDVLGEMKQTHQACFRTPPTLGVTPLKGLQSSASGAGFACVSIAAGAVLCYQDLGGWFWGP